MFKEPKIEQEKSKEEFAKERFQEIEEDLEKIKATPEDKRTTKEKYDFETLETLMMIKEFQKEFEEQGEPYPGLTKKDSIVLFSAEHPGFGGGEEDSESVIEKKCFTDRTKDFQGRQVKEGESFNLGLIRAKILGKLYETDKSDYFNEDQQKEILEGLEKGKEKKFVTDMPGIEIAFTKTKREARPGSEIAKHENFDPGYTEAILVRYYNQEKKE